MTKRAYSTSEVAELFGVSRKTVWLWCKEGRIKALRTPGGTYRIPAEEVKRLCGRLPDED